MCDLCIVWFWNLSYYSFRNGVVLERTESSNPVKPVGIVKKIKHIEILMMLVLLELLIPLIINDRFISGSTRQTLIWQFQPFNRFNRLDDLNDSNGVNRFNDSVLCKTTPFRKEQYVRNDGAEWMVLDPFLTRKNLKQNNKKVSCFAVKININLLS